MNINGIFITLCPITLEHLPLMVNWRNSPSVAKMMFDRTEFTLERQTRWFEKLKNDPTREQFIILENKFNRPIGAINLINIDRNNLHCDWGYYIGEDEYRMGGYSIEAEYLILKHAFEKVNLNKVYCQTFAHNKKVVAIHKKFGFAVDGILRQHYRIESGFEDVVVMSILKSEFDIKSAEIESLLNFYNR
jgi:UDP-4-amino-4,6-dideoxy-N-acetyl-beta-L-altrosamine N-acetyltransferase